MRLRLLHWGDADERGWNFRKNPSHWHESVNPHIEATLFEMIPVNQPLGSGEVLGGIGSTPKLIIGAADSDASAK